MLLYIDPIFTLNIPYVKLIYELEQLQYIVYLHDIVIIYVTQTLYILCINTYIYIYRYTQQQILNLISSAVAVQPSVAARANERWGEAARVMELGFSYYIYLLYTPYRYTSYTLDTPYMFFIHTLYIHLTFT